MKKYRTKVLLKELFRKSIHLCSAAIPLCLKHFYLLTVILLVLVVIGYSLCEILRLKGHQIPIISKITEIAARKRDEGKFVFGPVTLVIGILTAAIFLPLKNATIGIFALAFGDGLASLCGKFIGHVHIPFTKGKTAAGSLACFSAVYISSFTVCKDALLSLKLASIGMFLELIPLKDFDNILIPIVIGGLSMFL